MLVANEKQMAMLMTEKMMTEEMEEKIMTEEVEEKVTCFDCNVSVLPSEIQVATNKHFYQGAHQIWFLGARYKIPCGGRWYNGQSLQ